MSKKRPRKPRVAFLTALLLAALPLAAAEPEIEAIRQAYAKAAAAIARAQKGEADAMYCNELILNAKGGSWRAAGTYGKKAAFWYSDQPEFLVAAGKRRESALVKVEVRETVAATAFYREFFFLAGEPAFYFRQEQGDGPNSGERLYFRDGRPLLRLKGEENVAASGGETTILAEARYWQELFLLGFGPAKAQAGEKHPIDAWLAERLAREPSTRETKEILAQAYEKWGAELNWACAALGSELDAAALAGLQAAQRGWFAFRELELAWLARFYGGLDGSMFGVMLASDRMELVRNRAQQMVSLLETLKSR